MQLEHYLVIDRDALRSVAFANSQAPETVKVFVFYKNNHEVTKK
jgi:hypothetical protein